ncbi:HAD-IB family hydrolase [Gordonia sp. HNM0687]|uniref:HAD-IB family hydrolase n=1 Tax=Gordonia mangrovi TaxID=2665643 RepID=A0A6L7GYF9_9ACTN|nr:HAD-IB family hydrolase [Gordonia mangrovi]MXP23735.1 HAD-IB family hydrolase [Gordonia mangrovi]UVF79792.1 HAD-IB family hydrolase [Gordonia mangrovi]
MTDTSPASYPQARSAPATAPTRRSAAFFDLDKTVIAKSSVLAFSRAFFAEGLLDRRWVIKSGYAQLRFRLMAADQKQVEHLRQHATEMCRGWNVAHVRAVVAEALHEVVHPLVFDEAAELIATHRARGDDVILVSASGREMVEPIGGMLGVDHVVASEMTVVNGHYTGELEVYLYGPAKAAAVSELAEDRGYDLATCYAYSDSITDLPMLEAVGHPFVVNPDRRLRRRAIDEGWPVLDFVRPTSHSSRPGSQRRRTPSRYRTAAVAGAVCAGLAVAGGMGTHALRRYGQHAGAV